MLKNITLKAEEDLIRKAKEKAQNDHVSLSAIFRQWLVRYVGRKNDNESEVSGNYEALMKDISYARAGQSFSRDEMNER